LKDRVARNPKVDWHRNRAIVFLDPFGMQVPWSTIELLAATKAIEVFINFPEAMAIQRLLLRSGEFTAAERKRLDEYFGSSEWYNVLYKEHPTLFGDTAIEKVEKPGLPLVRWYRKRLEKAFGYASKAALIRNTKNKPLYYLLLATPNKTGVKIANHILSAGEYID
jgi:three-Cys-motif partner protein